MARSQPRKWDCCCEPGSSGGLSCVICPMTPDNRIGRSPPGSGAFQNPVTQSSSHIFPLPSRPLSGLSLPPAPLPYLFAFPSLPFLENHSLPRGHLRRQLLPDPPPPPQAESGPPLGFSEPRAPFTKSTISLYSSNTMTRPSPPRAWEAPGLVLPCSLLCPWCLLNTC